MKGKAHFRIRGVDCGKCNAIHIWYKYRVWRDGKKVQEEYIGRCDEKGNVDERDFTPRHHNIKPKVTRPFNNLHNCALCYKPDELDTEGDSDYLRPVYVDNQGRFHRGFFRPHVSPEELWKLKGKGEMRVCSNRAACRKRQEANR